MEFCINCGTSIDGDFCDFCKESINSIYETGIYNYCWNCGSEFDNNNTHCDNCNIEYNQLKNELVYIDCPICNKQIDPVYDCPYHDTCSTELIRIKSKIINIYKNKTTLNNYLTYHCPFDIKNLVQEFVTEKPDDERIRLSHKSVLDLILVSTKNNQKYIFDAIDYIKEKINIKNLTDNRVEKLKKNLPDIMHIIMTDEQPIIFQKDIDKWLENIKF